MDRVLLVDTNRASYPAYQALVGWGHEVWVAGGIASEPLARMCPNYVAMDYSDVGALSALIKAKRFDFLVPGCTDLSYKVCAAVAGGGFPGIDNAEATRAINEKGAFREMAVRLGLSVPRVFGEDEASEVPAVIVKPVDSFSGRGMVVLRGHSREELAAACHEARKASRSGECLIEEFVEGQLFSHSAFIRGGEIIADFIVREDCTTNPFTVDTSRVEYEFPAEMREALRSAVRSLASHLQLVDGLVHTQFITDGSRHWLIEVTRRCPGDLYALLIEMSTGYPYGAAYAAPFVGKEAPGQDAGSLRKRIIRHTATSRDGEFLWGFHFNRPVDLKLLLPLATAGERLDPSPYGRAALFFLEAQADTEMQSLYRSLLDRTLYTLQ